MPRMFDTPEDGDWESWTEAEQEELLAIAGETLRALGYEAARSPTRA